MKSARSKPPSDDAPSAPTGPSPLTIYTIVGVIVGLVAAGSWYVNDRVFPQSPDGGRSLPVLGTITGDLEATTSDGRPAAFSELQGKVIACSYLFTKCPHGCAMVFGSMRKLHERFRTHRDFHLASIAVLPDQDPPGFLKEFASGQGLTAQDPWTFYSGFTRQQAWDFMHENLQMEMTRETPPAERVSLCDFCEHDLRIALVDRHRRVRGLYQVMNPDAATRELTVETLFKDVAQLLADPTQ